MNKNLLWHDPVVAEIHLIREHLANRYHDDLMAYSKAAEEHCRALGLNIVEIKSIDHALLPATTFASTSLGSPP